MRLGKAHLDADQLHASYFSPCRSMMHGVGLKGRLDCCVHENICDQRFPYLTTMLIGAPVTTPTWLPSLIRQSRCATLNLSVRLQVLCLHKPKLACITTQLPSIKTSAIAPRGGAMSVRMPQLVPHVECISLATKTDTVTPHCATILKPNRGCHAGGLDSCRVARIADEPAPATCGGRCVNG
jgi:hypothetical protein